MAVTTISCESGKITITTYEGTGSASFMNGSSVYSTYEENVDDFGSYSGKDVTILESMNIDENGYKLTYKGAYVSEDKFIVNMESSDSSGNSYTYDLVFTKA